MSCNTRMAEAWSYANFWCFETLIMGADNSGGAANAFLTDTLDTATFTTQGLVGNIGQILYNLTQDTNGPVTAATETTLIATGVTWDDGDLYRISTISGADISRINFYLDTTAADIHSAMGASGQCDCTLASWASTYLAKLNIIEAGIFHQCPCNDNHLSEVQERMFLDWVTLEIEAITTGKKELCAGETGSEFPYTSWAEQSTTEFAAARIIANDINRNR